MFLECLWGIETDIPKLYYILSYMFLECLWGIETLVSKYWYSMTKIQVFRVPMRNWNIETYKQICISPQVFRVPMRNWNPPDWAFSSISFAVFRVPMRNWNVKFSKKIFFFIWLFLECLWGIETLTIEYDAKIHREFLECLWGIETVFQFSILFRWIFVFRVPMRNWNFFILTILYSLKSSF